MFHWNVVGRISIGTQWSIDIAIYGATDTSYNV